MLHSKALLAFTFSSALLALPLAGPAMAAVVVPPAGATYYVEWNDLGFIDEIYDTNDVFTDLGTSWELSIGAETLYTINAVDDFLLGDEFDLYIDGALVPWTVESVNADGYFDGRLLGYALSPGSYLVELFVRETNPDIASGAAFVSFGDLIAVPAPASIALAASGLALLGAAGWRRRA